MNAVVLVPVKDSARAKARMAGILSPEERSRLAQAMLNDLVCALQPLAARVALVTDSGAAATIAAKFGWRVFWETRQITESTSVDAASHQLAAEKTGSVLRLPADIPLARSEDIRRLLDIPLKPRSAVLVPSRDGAGTNAVLRKPPDLFPSRFGNNSLVLHRQEALRAQAHVEVVEVPRLALDLDEPADLMQFLEQESETATRRLLMHLNIMDRLVHNARG